MARKSRQLTNILPSFQPWKTAIYIRLSREDMDKDESLSVRNQRILLLDYVNNNPEFDLVDIYIDDGFSGTDSNRPNFKRMLEDIRNKVINCIIVKDLSRFGRNYIEVGNYLELLFPNFNVRFISLGDNLDSYKSPSEMSSLIVPFKNLINDNYCREASEKIRKVFDMKRKKGEFIGAFAPYGYIKDEKNYNKLIVDKEVAPIIKDIFQWFISGMSKLSITRKLNSLGIPSPSVYKRQKGMKYHCNKDKFGDSPWCSNSVTTILKNPVYIGNMVQGRFKVMSYKIHKQIKQSEGNWFIVENTHEPIISKEIFLNAQELQKRDTRISPNNEKLYLFAGFLRCGDCGKAMARKKSKNYVYYICSKYKNSCGTDCSKHTINNKTLEDVVLKVIQKQISLAVYSNEIIEICKNFNKKSTNSGTLESALSLNEEKLKEISFFKKSIYEDWKHNYISREDYFDMKNEYDKEEKKIKDIVSKLKFQIEEDAGEINTQNPFLTSFIKHKNITHLSRELLIELVDKIIIHSKSEIEIKFKFVNEYKKILKFIGENKKDEKIQELMFA